MSPEFTLTEQEQQHLHQLYKELHAHPELSMQEHRTAERIEQRLSALGIEHFRCGGTGVVGVVRNGEGPVVALRADTDALPVAEHTGVDYASTAQGTLPDGTSTEVMHACGHDTHMACLLTAAGVLLRQREDWSGTLVLIFQPAEETGQGARAMVADGLWEKVPHPEVILGQHVSPGDAGTVTMALGPAMAAADNLRVTVYGKQVHGSQPQNGIDPVVLGASMVTRLQSIVSREVDPRDPAVVTVAVFRAGLKENIIPETAEFTVNIRTLTESVRQQVLAAVERIIRAEAQSAGAPDPVIEHYGHMPALINDAETAQGVFDALRGSLGADRVAVERPRMGSEDFGVLGEQAGVPSVFWFFGASEHGAEDPPGNHSPYFAPLIEPTLSTGVEAMVTAALHRLSR
ncbi:amidohydrolase [Nesterenkonia alba]|uniref:amidohydrolase n=1 Tax=Nesterenkonia alba TaxID=515814 RepID=UPI000527C82A